MTFGTAATSWNLELMESLYQQWRQDPDSVDPSWGWFFQGFELGLQQTTTGGVEAPKQTAVARLITTYRLVGHYAAHIDPLDRPPPGHPLLELSQFGLKETDLERVFDLSWFIGLKEGTLRELLTALKETYCRTIGVEYMQILDTAKRHWLQERMEPTRNQRAFTHEEKFALLRTLHYAELFEKFLGTKYKGGKRFSLEGAETLLAMLEALVKKTPQYQVREIILGMAHRGRLNVLANILRKPYEAIFAQFEENFLPEQSAGDGDVKYHLGFSSNRELAGGYKLHLSLTPNPSHLEAVNPVVEGRTRAKQTLFGDTERIHGLPVLIHGDAAFAGQGLVAETLNLSQLDGYKTGGTIHIVVNNQIGFTTDPRDARSTPYCTDIAKMIQVPIFHVNTEDPEAAVFVTELALEYRQTFHTDVVIDLVCYRRHGHNEGDEPSFTQPVMYRKIRSRPSVSTVYAERLLASGELTPAENRELTARFEAKLQKVLDEVHSGPAEYPVMRGFDGRWRGLTNVYSFTPVNTAVSEDALRFVSERLTHVPEGFSVPGVILKNFKNRHQALLEGKPLPWPQAELLAFGTLLLEGTPIRLSGQDSQRGTFSSRHAVLVDTETGKEYCPLAHLAPEQALFQVYDSMLSEAAVLGFEYGYALDAPDTLVLWEAQFGDFSNGAQVILDQFVSSGESKWQRGCGVVLLLPHGYEGQGPEHSSARLERFLQLCAEDNMEVVYPTTPAQYFHLLRRQMKRRFRKPLVVMTPKSLLRLEAAQSPVSEFTEGGFHEILDDPDVTDARAVRRVLLCSGKVYYDLAAKRGEEGRKDVAIVRIEQLYPLHDESLRAILKRYGKAKEWVWVQEESQNMGAWTYIEPRLRALGYELLYVGRDASASPATGSLQVHRREQAELVETAISGPAPHTVRAPNVIRARGAEEANGAAADRKPAPASS